MYNQEIFKQEKEFIRKEVFKSIEEYLKPRKMTYFSVEDRSVIIHKDEKEQIQTAVYFEEKNMTAVTSATALRLNTTSSGIPDLTAALRFVNFINNLNLEFVLSPRLILSDDGYNDFRLVTNIDYCAFHSLTKRITCDYIFIYIPKAFDIIADHLSRLLGGEDESKLEIELLKEIENMKKENKL